MSRTVFLIISVVCAVAICRADDYYRPDTLGNGFLCHTYHLPDDYHGAVVATLVKKNAPQPSDKALLYVHGYNDYFFQTELARQFTDSCFNFYAIDLRKYGRSILPGQYPFEVRDLSEYFTEIDSAICTIKNEGNSEIVLMGHSTGGLITSLYCDARKDSLAVQALILNSPFLEWNFNAFFRNFLIPTVSWIGSFAPDLSLPDETRPSAYGQSLLDSCYGEWTFDTSWKKLQAHGQRFGWIRAIDKGHDKIHQGMDIPCPILLMYSDKSIRGKEWSAQYQEADAVLNVDDIARYGKQLGNNVTSVVITDGMHDLLLSRPEVRATVYTEMFKWLKNNHLMQ